MEKCLLEQKRFNQMNFEEIREMEKYCKGLEIEIKINQKAINGNP